MQDNTLLEAVLQELLTIKKGMPNGELKALTDDMKELKQDLSELKSILLNPDDGVIVKTNKNTEFRQKVEANDKDFQQQMNEVAELSRWKDNVNRALWIIFAALIGIAFKLLF